MTDSELHAHIFMDGKDYKKCVALHEKGPNEEHIRKVFSAYKERDITFIREGGDHFGVSLLAKELASEYGITYLSPVCALYKEGEYGKVAGVSYSTMKEYAGLVSKVKSQGADFIKLMLSGILDFNSYGVVSSGNYSLNEMKELIHIAHSEGFSVMAHVSGCENVLNAITAGVDSLEHGYYISDEGISALKKMGCIWVPTAVTSENLKGCGRFDEYTTSKIADEHQENIRKAYEAGAMIGCGSDAGAFRVLHGRRAEEEYELLCRIMGPSGEAQLRESSDLVKSRFSIH